MTLSSTDSSEAIADAEDGIRVTELFDAEAATPGGVFGAVLSAYYRQGKEAGYDQAVKDMLAALVPMTEEFLRHEAAPSPELRKFVYGFGALVEQYLTRLSSGGPFVEGGLGI